MGLEKRFAWRRPPSLAAWGKALRKARHAAGLTLDELAAQTHISKPYLSNIETARAPGPASAEKLVRIARALGLDAEAVAAGADFLRAPASIRRLVARGAEGGVPARRADGSIDVDAWFGGEGPAPGGAAGGGPLELKAVPLINRVAAGHAAEYTDLEYPVGIADDYVAAPDLPGMPASTGFALRVEGDSMMPEYRPGEILIVGPGDVADGEDCVVRLGALDHYATTFKRVYFERDAEGHTTAVRLVARNPTYAERIVPPEQVSGIYPLRYRLVPARRGE